MIFVFTKVESPEPYGVLVRFSIYPYNTRKLNCMMSASDKGNDTHLEM